jgi:hypothetical protein
VARRGDPVAVKELRRKRRRSHLPPAPAGHDLKAAYEEAIGHPTSDSTVYNVLNRHDWRKLMPRPFHPDRDIEAQDNYKKRASQRR